MTGRITEVANRSQVADQPQTAQTLSHSGFYLGRTIIVLQDAASKTVLVFIHTIRALAIEPLLESLQEFISNLRSSLSSTTSIVHESTQIEIPYDINNPPKLWKTLDAKIRQSKLNHTCSRAAIKSLCIPKKLKSSSSFIQTTHFGAGIANGVNTCFIAPVLQCLRFSPTVRSRLGAAEMQKLPLAKKLSEFFDIMEGKNGKQKRTITGDEIASFRKLALKLGWPERDEFSEEDPKAFCQFLLDHLGFPTFKLPNKISYNLKLPIRSMLAQGERDTCISSNNILLSSGEKPGEKKLTELVHRNLINEEVDKESIEKTLTSKSHKKRLHAYKQTRILTKQSVQLYQNDIPHVLPIGLKRCGFDQATSQNFKPKDRIIPTPTLDISLADHPTAKVRYKLISITVHDGAGINSGHHRAYIPAELGKERAYVGFNDSQSHICFDKEFIENDIATNGHLFFYELVGIVNP
jgi:ubiquitin C-terminal hydrolase